MQPQADVRRSITLLSQEGGKEEEELEWINGKLILSHAKKENRYILLTTSLLFACSTSKDHMSED